MRVLCSGYCLHYKQSLLRVSFVDKSHSMHAVCWQCVACCQSVPQLCGLSVAELVVCMSTSVLQGPAACGFPGYACCWFIWILRLNVRCLSDAVWLCRWFDVLRKQGYNKLPMFGCAQSTRFQSAAYLLMCCANSLMCSQHKVTISCRRLDVLCGWFDVLTA